MSHEIRVDKFMSDKLAVMKEGKIVEMGDAKEIYGHPGHSYTRSLLDSIPNFAYNTPFYG